MIIINQKLRQQLSIFLLGILAGIAISIGGVCYLSLDSKIVGAILFTVGLFTVVTNGLYLFTGKVCYTLDNRPSYLITLLFSWLGNLVGAVIVGSILKLTRISNISTKAQALCETKLNDDIWSVLILSIFCGIMMYIAVVGFTTNKHEFGKYLGLFFGVVGFILCGYEHCVANMFYITIGNAWSWHALLYLIIMTIGNAIGGLLFPAVFKLSNYLQSPKPKLNDTQVIDKSKDENKIIDNTKKDN